MNLGGCGCRNRQKPDQDEASQETSSWQEEVYEKSFRTEDWLQKHEIKPAAKRAAGIVVYVPGPVSVTRLARRFKPERLEDVSSLPFA